VAGAAVVVAVATAAAGAATNWTMDDAPARVDTGRGVLFSAAPDPTQGIRLPQPRAGRRLCGAIAAAGCVNAA
jgi:hypothetical protein